MRNSSLQKATLGLKKVDESVLKLADNHQRSKEEHNKRINQLEKQLDKAKQATELEVKRLKGTLEVMKYQEMESMKQELEEKTRDLEDLECLNQTLMVKECKSNDELQDARKELINGLEELSRSAQIGVKRMGYLDDKPFINSYKRKYSARVAEYMAGLLCKVWDVHLGNPEWHPFKIIKVDGKEQEIVDEEDEKLKGLKNDLGDEVCRTVTTALKERNEYNPCGRYLISEAWNYKEEREATLKEEGISFLLEQLKKYKHEGCSKNERPQGKCVADQ